MITIKKYHFAQKESWDAFVASSINGTLFQKQGFLEYHLKRKFEDHSLIIKKNKVIIGLLPAAIKKQKNKKILYSHPGASYGGLILKQSFGFSDLHNIILSLDEYCKNQDFSSIVMINSPIIYFKTLDSSLDYLLQWNGFKQKESYISHVINMSNITKIETLLQKKKTAIFK